MRELVTAAFLTLTAAQLFDLATFIVMVERAGLDAEANPLVASLYGMYGFPVVAIAKVALLALVTAIGAVLLARPMHPRLAAVAIGLGILAGLIGGLSNAAVIGIL